jgi:Cu(I)/Ag(I) efflux system protein CusF
MTRSAFLWLACILAACAAVLARGTEAGGGIEIGQARAVKSAGATASGVVRDVDRANSRIKLDHGPIASIGMPAMTMTFKVKNPALL